MGGTAQKAATATLVGLSIVVAALALWTIRLVIALVLLGFVIAAAMRPGVEWLNRRAHVPRVLGVLLHYVLLLGLLGVFLWLVVPHAVDQIGQAIGHVPTSAKQLHNQAAHSHGLRHDVLQAIDRWLRRLPSGTSLLHPAISVTKTVLEAVAGVFFTFAVAAYWIFERDGAIGLVQSMLPRRHRRITRDTWVLIDDRLGAFVRGQLVLILFVATVLSFAFWLVGEPYWLLLGGTAGIVEIVPIVGPVAAAVLAIGVGLTAGWGVALGAGIAVVVLRQLEDYVIVPRVLGHAVGLSPLVVLVSVTVVGFLLGAFYVLLAIPLAAMTATILDVVVRERDPADEEPPTVLFPAKEAKR
ncbi:MAG TPA: AI-2E family transporter [Gaiellaceae bacterium]|nr:AI-2E family transporter [Gaiellaceae bacterium]